MAGAQHTPAFLCRSREQTQLQKNRSTHFSNLCTHQWQIRKLFDSPKKFLVATPNVEIGVKEHLKPSSEARF